MSLAKVKDGFLWKKSRLGMWQKKYVRTELHLLTYFSEGLETIEAATIADGGTARSPYQYRTVGITPADELDMREVVPDSVVRIDRTSSRPLSEDELAAEEFHLASTGSGEPPHAAAGSSDACAYFRIVFAPSGRQKGPTTLLWRAPSAQLANEWVAVLRNISLEHRTAGMQPIGDLAVEVRRVIVLADGSYKTRRSLPAHAVAVEFAHTQYVAPRAGFPACPV